MHTHTQGADIESACKGTVAVVYQLRSLCLAQPEHESPEVTLLWSLDQAIDRLIDTLEKYDSYASVR